MLKREDMSRIQLLLVCFIAILYPFVKGTNEFEGQHFKFLSLQNIWDISSKLQEYGRTGFLFWRRRKRKNEEHDLHQRVRILCSKLQCHCSRKLAFQIFDKVIGDRMRNATLAKQGKIWEYSGRFQGDIYLDILRNGKGSADMRREFTDVYNDQKIHKWSQGIVLYRIDRKYFKWRERYIIKRIMSDVSKKTCLVFARAPDHYTNGYLLITGYRSGCFAHVGFQRQGITIVNLQSPWCLNKPTILHELMHAVGFRHPHTKSSRNWYIQIKRSNVKTVYQEYLDPEPPQYGSKINLPYDFNSIMHSSGVVFSSNGRQTIVPWKSHMKLGEAKDLSAIDIATVQTMYKGECHRRDPGLVLRKKK